MSRRSAELKDINGIEIHEGDSVGVSKGLGEWNPAVTCPQVLPVVFRYGCFGVEPAPPSLPWIPLSEFCTKRRWVYQGQDIALPEEVRDPVCEVEVVGTPAERINK